MKSDISSNLNRTSTKLLVSTEISIYLWNYPDICKGVQISIKYLDMYTSVKISSEMKYPDKFAPIEISRYWLRYPDIYRGVDTSIEVSRQLQKCPDIYRGVQISTKVSRYLYKYPNIYSNIQTKQDMFIHL